ncbi:MAG TPA: efflux RND transporter periplasmic adaptor subunit [Acidobacteriota bacterium]|nr:efflux RND transporter periplasmic adaptor subunit [Acidobacteriota bacterium]
MSPSSRAKWPRIRKALISVLILVAAAAVMVTVARMPERTEDLPPKQVPAVNVEVVQIEAISRMPDILELPATLEPNRVVQVPVELAGKIEEVFVTEGEAVEKGKVILRLDTALLQAEFERAKAQAEFDKRTRDRSMELLEKGVLNKSQVEEVEARATISAVALNVAQTKLERATVKAPLTGVLNVLSHEAGEYVSAGDTVAQIVEIAKIKVVVQIPERDVRYLSLGDRIELSVDSLPGVNMSGSVTYRSEVADTSTRTTRIEVTVDNSGRRLHTGMIVRARISRRNLTNVIMIPLSSVIPLEEGRVVYVASEDRAERREVELGIIRGSQVQVLSGLEPDDLLIVRGHRQVGPNQLIRVVDEPGP